MTILAALERAISHATMMGNENDVAVLTRLHNQLGPKSEAPNLTFTFDERYVMAISMAGGVISDGARVVARIPDLRNLTFAELS